MSGQCGAGDDQFNYESMCVLTNQVDLHAAISRDGEIRWTCPSGSHDLQSPCSVTFNPNNPKCSTGGELPVGWQHLRQSLVYVGFKCCFNILILIHLIKVLYKIIICFSRADLEDVMKDVVL